MHEINQLKNRKTRNVRKVLASIALRTAGLQQLLHYDVTTHCYETLAQAFAMWCASDHFLMLSTVCAHCTSNKNQHAFMVFNGNRFRHTASSVQVWTVQDLDWRCRMASSVRMAKSISIKYHPLNTWFPLNTWRCRMAKSISIKYHQCVLIFVTGAVCTDSA